MSLPRGPSRFWAFAFRAKLVRAFMPFWRVVVEARLDRQQRDWPENVESGVAAVFVWARTIEEAEGLAALALEDEGMRAVTADAVKCPPAARPRRVPAAVAKSEIGFVSKHKNHARLEPPPRRGARA